MSDFTVIDIETTGSLPWKNDLVAVGVGEKVHRPDAGMKAATKILSDPTSLVVCHSNYDLRWLVLNGCPFVEGVRFHDTKVMAFLLDKTQGILGLDDLAQRYLGVPKLAKPVRERSVDGVKRIMYDCEVGMGLCPELGVIPIEDVPWPEMEAYNAQDLRVTADLYLALKALMQEGPEWEEFFLKEESKVSRLLVETEVAGFAIDVPATQAWLDEAMAEHRQLEGELVAMTGVPSFNLRASDMVASYLYDELPQFKVQIEVPELKALKPAERREVVMAMVPPCIKVDRVGSKWVYGRQVADGRGLKPPKPKRNKQGKEGKRAPITAGVLALSFRDDPWVAKYLHWKALNTLCVNYLQVWVDAAHNGRLHGRFDQSRAATGRLASKDPNLQAVPSSMQWNIRKLFRPEEENQLVIGDFHGMDVRVAANFSRDPLMCEIFNTGQDFYGVLASEIWGGPPDKKNPNRTLMKILALSIQYSAGPSSIAEKISMSGLGHLAKDAKKLLKMLEETLPVLYEWRQKIERDAIATGYVETMTGRRRYLPDLYSDDWGVRAGAQRMCVATVVQGSSADVIRRAIVRGRDEISPSQAYMVHQVHDEVIWQKGPAWEDDLLPRIREIFEAPNGFDLVVPMKFEVEEGTSWDDKGSEGTRAYRILERNV